MYKRQGYVGYDEGGQLTEAVRRKPYSVVLFDEIEKAHPDVFNVLLQVLDDGRITDSQGRTVDFKNTILIMTSNIGANYLLEGIKEDGSIDEQSQEMVMDDLKAHFRPECLNRLDEIIMFKPLTKTNVRSIIDLLVADVNRRLEAVSYTHLSGCGKSGGNTEVKQNENSNKITLMTQDTTYGKAFDEYIHKAEEATGLEIETIACPTNTDDRQAKITTILSSGDDSIDVVTINDEMMSGFKNTGYLEPLQDTVMTPEIMENFPQKYMQEMTMVGDNVYSVPCFMDVLAFWVDEEKMANAGLTEIKTKEAFEKYTNEGYDVICLTGSSKTSGTYQSARCV